MYDARTVVDLGYPKRQPTVNFSPKMHGNKETWTEGGRSPHPPWIYQWRCMLSDGKD